MSVSNSKRVKYRPEKKPKVRKPIELTLQQKLAHAVRSSDILDIQGLFRSTMLDAAYRSLLPQVQEMVDNSPYYLSPKFHETVGKLPEHAVMLHPAMGLEPYAGEIVDNLIELNKLDKADALQLSALVVYATAVNTYLKLDAFLWYSPGNSEVPFKIWFHAAKDNKYAAMELVVDSKAAVAAAAAEQAVEPAPETID